MPRYTLRFSDQAAPTAFASDSVAEIRKVAEARSRTYGNEYLRIVRSRDGWIDELDGHGFCAPADEWLALEGEGAAEVQRSIQESPEATARVLSYLDRRGVGHSGQISANTLGALCGVDGRTWRRWIGGDRAFPAAAARLCVAVAFGTR